MVHAVRIKDGAASYANRLVQTHRLANEKQHGFAMYQKVRLTPCSLCAAPSCLYTDTDLSLPCVFLQLVLTSPHLCGEGCAVLLGCKHAELSLSSTYLGMHMSARQA